MAATVVVMKKTGSRGESQYNKLNLTHCNTNNRKTTNPTIPFKKKHLPTFALEESDVMFHLNRTEYIQYKAS